jgi:hypothetical protein
VLCGLCFENEKNEIAVSPIRFEGCSPNQTESLREKRQNEPGGATKYLKGII